MKGRIKLKTIKITGDDWFEKKEYQCINEWPEDCLCQGGTSGVVFGPKGNYSTAFFEAFPKNPDTYIRGEGGNIQEAENDAWNKYQKIINCDNHTYERRGYKNGCGVCSKCDLVMLNIFEPDENCKICGKPTYYVHDINGNWYCKEHAKNIPYELMTYFTKMYMHMKSKGCYR